MTTDFIDFIVSDKDYRNQKDDNLNPDGTDNMVRSKWGRFNQCFTSSGSATVQQNNRYRKRIGIAPSDSQPFVCDERAYGIIINGAKITEHKGTVTVEEGYKEEPNSDRFSWDKHCNLMTLVSSDYCKTEIRYRFEDFNFSKLQNQVEAGYETIISINARDYYAGAEGHVIAVVGTRKSNKDGKLLGFIVDDPAGQITAKNSYKDDLSGENVFFTVEFLDKLTRPRPLLKSPNTMWKSRIILIS
jgi:hypothetical protein